MVDNLVEDGLCLGVECFPVSLLMQLLAWPCSWPWLPGSRRCPLAREGLGGGYQACCQQPGEPCPGQFTNVWEAKIIPKSIPCNLCAVRSASSSHKSNRAMAHGEPWLGGTCMLDMARSPNTGAPRRRHTSEEPPPSSPSWQAPLQSSRRRIQIGACQNCRQSPGQHLLLLSS